MNENEDPRTNPYASPSVASVNDPPPSYRGPKSLLPIVRTNQMIRTALIMGILMIALVTGFSVKKNSNVELTLISILIGGAIFVSTTAASFVLPYLMKPSSKVPRSNQLSAAIAIVDEKETLPAELTPLLEMYSKQSIVVGALFEGGALINCIFWVLGHNVLHLLLVALAIGFMALRFPSVSGLRSFLMQQTRSLD